VGKLVLFLADGTTTDVPLDRERITIGRRADNDVCLPYPAVSGEHAAVVTILADSFLEDLGSTNGTLVNGRPVTKHFLADRDLIDIGRQRFTYLADDDAKVDPLPPDIARTFKEQPPLVPHATDNFDEITVEENQCLSCHSLEKFKEKKAPRIGDSHLAADGQKKVVTMDRYQCNSCHVPQVDARPLVDNTFVGNMPQK